MLGKELSLYATQYACTLPADYDVRIVRDRVATRGHALDDFRGLAVTANLMRARGRAGSPVNHDAPCYLSADVAGKRRFLWGCGGFHGIVSNLGRPRVPTGPEQRCPRPAVGDKPRFATHRLEGLPVDSDPATAGAAAVTALEAVALPGTHSGAVAVNPSRWELLTLVLRVDALESYEVLHLSRPDLDQLGDALPGAGPHWR